MAEDEENRFNELLSSKLSERDFPFDELSWDDAERLIIEEEKRRKFAGILLIFSAGLAVGILVMLPFMINVHPVVPNFAVSNTAKPASVPKNASSSESQVQNNMPLSNKNIPIEEKTSSPVQPAFVNKETGTGAGRISSHNRSFITNAANKRPSDFVTSGTKDTSKMIAREENLPQQTMASQEGAPSSASPANANAPASSNTPSQTGSMKPAGNSIPQGNAITPAAQTSAPIAPDVIALNNIAPPKNSALPAANNGEPNKNNIPAKPKKDSNVSHAAEYPMIRGTEPVDKPVYFANILSAYIGGAYSFGWNNNGIKEANGITFLGGIDYTHYFGSKISASAGAGYAELNSLETGYTSSVIQYDFGLNENVVKVTPQTIYYITVPVKVQYSFDDKNMLSVGGEYLVMLTTQSLVNSYHQTYFEQTLLSSVKENGYTQGFSNYDIQGTISYTRMLTFRLGVRLELYHGFEYIRNSTFPGTNQLEQNNGVRVAISYQLVK